MSRRAALLASAALLCCGCAKQEPALRVTLSTTSFSIPANTDELVMDVSDNNNIVFVSYSYTLKAGMSFPLTLVLVEDGAAHPHVKVATRLLLRSSIVGTGAGEADFQSGKTVDLAITLSP